MSWFKSFLRNTAGFTTVEYGLVVLGITAMAISTLAIVDPELNVIFIPH